MVEDLLRFAFFAWSLDVPSITTFTMIHFLRAGGQVSTLFSDGAELVFSIY